jgi:hypothetical protein
VEHEPERCELPLYQLHSQDNSPGALFFSEQEDEEYRQLLKRAAELKAHREERRKALALSKDETEAPSVQRCASPEVELGSGARTPCGGEARIEDEAVASQVLTSMLLVRTFLILEGHSIADFPSGTSG